MKVTVSLEVRFDVLPDGSVWTISNYHQSFWERYLTVFEHVEIVARANPVEVIPQNARRVDRFPDIQFTSLPFYLGPIQYAKKWFALRNKLKDVIANSESIIMRVGSPIADIMTPILTRSKIPYAVEVVGDPWDTLSPGSTSSRLRPILRWWLSHKLRKQTANAVGASYVTSVRLPERYPTKNEAFTIYASSIELKKDHIVEAPRKYTTVPTTVNLISVGALEDWRKGPDIAFKAIKELRAQGLDVKLTWLGDGRSRKDIEALAHRMGLKEAVLFLGQLPAGPAVFEELNKADIFILPTRGEGLPRALIEAMAMALPCVATDVGGIPELLPKDFIYDCEDHTRLEEILKILILHPEIMQQCSLTNWQKSHDYLSDTLMDRRKQLYQHLRQKCYEWKNSSSN